MRDGEIVAAASEDRFSRKKADERFPKHAVEFCLRQGGITLKDLAHVGFYDKPLQKFDRILETYFSVAPRGFRTFLMAGPLWIKEKLFTERLLRDGLGDYDGSILFSEHHEIGRASCRERVLQVV